MSAVIGDLVREVLATRQRGYVARTGMLNERELELLNQIRALILADHTTSGMLYDSEEGWAVVSDGEGLIVLVANTP